MVKYSIDVFVCSNAKRRLQKRRGPRGLGLGDFFRRALGDDLAAGISSLRADVEDPVGFGGDGLSCEWRPLL